MSICDRFTRVKDVLLGRRWKPPFYPLNYGDGTMGLRISICDCRMSSTITLMASALSVFSVLNPPSLASAMFLDRDDVGGNRRVHLLDSRQVGRARIEGAIAVILHGRKLHDLPPA